jgi:hypothetical protein
MAGIRTGYWKFVPTARLLYVVLELEKEDQRSKED